CAIPTPSRVNVLITTSSWVFRPRNLNLDTVEAIITTIQHYPVWYTHGKSEVITPQELSRLCSVEAENGDICFRWKLHEKLILVNKELSQFHSR
ncbi:hypothetical protein BGZ96_000328, partial [Linnemannia gamsii]